MYRNKWSDDAIAGLIITGALSGIFVGAFWFDGKHAVAAAIFLSWFIPWMLALFIFPIGTHLSANAAEWGDGRRRIAKAKVDAQIAEIETRSKLVQDRMKLEQKQLIDAMRM